MKSDRPRSQRSLTKAQLIEEVERLARVEGSRSEASGTGEEERLRRELAESLDRENATREILRAISSSPTDVQPVFDAIVESAARLCEASHASLYRAEGEVIRCIANYGEVVSAAVGEARPITRATASGRAILDAGTVHIADVLADADREFPDVANTIRRQGIRTVLGVPLMREGMPIGAITIRRTEVCSFSTHQIRLVEAFAAQAVIAIENARLFSELEGRNRDLAEALDQQTATAEILRVISRSPTDVQPVFDALATSAARLCDAHDAAIFLVDADMLRLVAHEGPIPAHPMGHGPPLVREIPPGRAVLERRAIHLADVQAEGDEYPEGSAIARRFAHHTQLATPLLRASESIGVIIVRRTEVRPFSDRQLELMQTFADQAVIAIENVRLFNETKEALERQTATAEILRVISQSPTDVQPVFDTIVRSATQLCEGVHGVVLRYDGALMHLVAQHGFPVESLKELRGRFPQLPSRDLIGGRAITERRVIHIPDLGSDPTAPADSVVVARIGGYRSLLAVPMMRGRDSIGCIVVSRGQAPFSDKQIALVETFADQAVIAIENVRLFSELQERNRELTQALDRQTATGEILRVISRSQTDLQPVFDTIAGSALRLFRAWSAAVYRFEGELLHVGAIRGGRPDSEPYIRQHYPMPLTGGSFATQCLRERAIQHVPDCEQDPDPIRREVGRARGFRAIVTVPMLRDGDPVGAINVTRVQPGPFLPAEIDLLQTFADQAVIAIENVRLFKELETRTHDLTRSVGELRALGEIGQAISSTLDLQTVLRTIVARATQLSGTDAGVIYEYEEQREVFLPRASEHLEAEIVETMLATPVRKGEGATGRLAEVQEPVQLPDILAAPAESRVRSALVHAGYRALLAVPLTRESHLLGALTVIRKATGNFAPDVIELLRTFATQSALAIQNARLFQEIEEKSRQLEAASQHKSEFLANMSHELRTPLNAIIGYSEMLQEEAQDRHQDALIPDLEKINAAAKHQLSLINDILDLAKIEAGRMELELTDFHLPTAIDNALTLVRERATRRGIALQATVDPRLGKVRADERKIKQVMLNLLSNAIKFTPEGGRIDVRALPVEGGVEVSVNDTGVGIAPEDQDAVFEEFRQVGVSATKQEGTGLGLTLCRKFVELHGGRIWVKSQTGVGSTFTFAIPMGIAE